MDEIRHQIREILRDHCLSTEDEYNEELIEALCEWASTMYFPHITEANRLG